MLRGSPKRGSRTQKLQMLESKEITEFAYRSVGVARTQPFPNFRERQLTGPRARAWEGRALQGHIDGRGKGEMANTFDSSSFDRAAGRKSSDLLAIRPARVYRFAPSF